ncbi:MAG: MoaD/ThiS family protein [Candidatus Thorarchaeota archaeon]|nr:MoaD/ThiS family protein [Candidatus Thorarchaeota archaeon]
MIAKITFKGPLVISMGRSEVSITIEQSDYAPLRAILTKLIETYPEIRKMWMTPKAIAQETLILSNGTDVSLMGELDANINDGDSILIIPLIHGGSQ